MRPRSQDKAGSVACSGCHQATSTSSTVPNGGSAIVTPEVTLSTGGWLPLPFLVAGTDLVAAVPERLARQVSGAAGVTDTEPPFGTVELVEVAWWHPMHATDPALSWLRAVVLSSLGSLALGRGQLAPDPFDEQAHLVCDEA